METWTLQLVTQEVHKRKSKLSPNACSAAAPVKFRAVDAQSQDHQLLVALARKSVADDTILRQHEAIVTNTLSLPSTFPEVDAAKSAGAAYSEAVKLQGKQHQLGPLFIHVWASFVTSIAAQSDAPQALRSALQQHAATIKQPSDLLGSILHCRVSAIWKPERFKLQVAVSPELRTLW